MPELCVVGSIVAAQGFNVPTASIRYRFVSQGASEGTTRGETHVCEADPIDDSLVFEHPVDVRFTMSSLCGWPQLFISVWIGDDLDRQEIGGYGIVRVPTEPGRHILEVVTWRPEGSKLQEIAAYFRGGYPQLTDTTVVLDCDRRHLLSTVSRGSVLVELDVICRGFEAHGVELAGLPALPSKEERLSDSTMP